ncbi:IMP cyclohydrolase [Chloroflexota bacterium]
MSNPNGPYPGRQLFTGLTPEGSPAFAYLVTGRSTKSRERRAVQKDNTVIMGPIGGEEYDPLRHYTAVKYDNSSGLLVVSNGIQTEAIFETYKLLYNVESLPTGDYLEKIMEGAMAEPDSMHTPRIAAVITGDVYLIGIVEHELPAMVFRIEPQAGTMTGISTYSGEMETAEPFDIYSELPKLEFKGRTAKDIADYLFEISFATNNGDDIRVCAIGGVFDKKNHTWDLAIVNLHQN